MNNVTADLQGWRNYRKYFARLPAYYQRRHEDNIFSALAVIGSIVGAAVLIIIAVLGKHFH